ncbi:MAG: response regulator [Nitrospirota bacterium]|nr:response regulator [Nitrospirota bacterium]
MPTKSVTILLVDDELDIQQQVAKVLAMQGYRVLEARHAIHALQLCKHYSGPIHLLLTDVVMPYMNGRELATAALAVRPQMRVLYISGHYEEILHSKGIDLLDKATFLQKPFSPSTLFQKIRDVLGHGGLNPRAEDTATLT